MPMDLANVTQAAVEQEVSQQFRAARGANPRVVHIQGWQAPDPNGDFVRAFPGFGGRAGRARAGNEVEVTTENLGAGKVAVFLVPNTQNPALQQLHNTIKLKVGEAQL